MLRALVLSEVGDQTWGAVLEDGQVVELHVENARRPGIAGNVYKGRVTRILPGMQSAFVDIGLERGAFLHVTDLPGNHGEEEPEDEVAGQESEVVGAGPGQAPFEIPESLAPHLPDEPDLRPDEGERWGVDLAERERARRVSIPIQDLLREGQEIVVQVAKEPFASKGARVTGQIGLPGRGLVYLPHMSRLFVSRRVDDPGERERLRAMAEAVLDGEGGWIVRTAAEGTDEEALRRDADYLKGTWGTILAKERRSGAPALLHHDLSLAERLLRDVVTEEFKEVVVDTEALDGAARAFLDRYHPGHGPRVRRVAGDLSILDQLGIHAEIERSMRSRLWLKGGGSIVVNPTEALVAIDVNTGKYVGKKDLEETALRTNLEAVQEIVRLLRLRDLGGIIVIDFIDLMRKESRDMLLRALAEELRKDRSRTKLLAMSDFGLVQLTRKRTRRSLDRILQSPCPDCGGTARIPSPSSLYYRIERDLARGSALGSREGPVVRLHPASAEALDALGLRLRVPQEASTAGVSGGSVRVVTDANLGEGDYELVW